MKPMSMPDIIFIVTHYIIFSLIFIGSLSLFLKNKYAFEIDYVILTFVSVTLLIAAVVTPYIGWGYGLDRAYLSFSAILAPMFVIGGMTLSKILKKERYGLFIVTMVLIAQILGCTYVIHQFFGVPRSVALNRSGVWSGEFYIYDAEVTGALWLYMHMSKDLEIYADAFGYARFIYNVNYKEIRISSFTFNAVKEGYIYLRHANVVDGIINPSFYYEDTQFMSNYTCILDEKNKVYDNAHTEIYVC